MRSYWRIAILVGTLMQLGCGSGDSRPAENSGEADHLHISHSVITTQTGFPQFLYMHHVLNGAKSAAEAVSLTGNISLENHSPNFSEVLWLLAYWKDSCPANDEHLKGASVIWANILKNPSQSLSSFPVSLHFANPLPMTGCVGFIFGGGPGARGEVTMSADLDLAYQPASGPANNVIDLSGEYCFGQNWGCQNATTDDGMGFGVPVTLPAGHLVALFGNIGDSTFDGTETFGPLPTGNTWGAANDFFLLPGGCGKFGENLNGHGFPNPVPLPTLYSWLPETASHLESVPLEYKIPGGGTGKATLHQQVERFFSVPVAVNSGDCMVVIYGRQGDGATDNETQVKAVLAP